MRLSRKPRFVVNSNRPGAEAMGVGQIEGAMPRNALCDVRSAEAGLLHRRGGTDAEKSAAGEETERGDKSFLSLAS